MSTLLTKLLHTVARTGQAGVEGYSRTLPTTQVQQPKKRGKGKAGCTPCEAMARKERARRLVGG